jgi:hypothetical protein
MTARTSWADALYYTSSDPAEIHTATAKLAQSIDWAIPARFADIPARTGATNAALALIGGGATPDAAAPLLAIVDGYGACYYDGNARSGSGGWSWLGARNLLNVQPLPVQGTSGGSIAIGSGSGYDFDTESGSQYRWVRVSVRTGLRSSITSPTTLAALGRVRVTFNGVEQPELQMSCVVPPAPELNLNNPPRQGAVTPANGSEITLHQSWEYPLRGGYTVVMLLDAPYFFGGGQIGATNTALQVTDLGPVG